VARDVASRDVSCFDQNWRSSDARMCSLGPSKTETHLTFGAVVIHGGFMVEWIPILASFFLGILVLRIRRGFVRTLVGATGIAISALAATLVSGEFRVSWHYLLTDLAEASVGFAAGSAAPMLFGRVKGAFTPANPTRPSSLTSVGSISDGAK
jgi:hypothetical protein